MQELGVGARGLPLGVGEIRNGGHGQLDDLALAVGVVTGHADQAIHLLRGHSGGSRRRARVLPRSPAPGSRRFLVWQPAVPAWRSDRDGRGRRRGPGTLGQEQLHRPVDGNAELALGHGINPAVGREHLLPLGAEVLGLLGQGLLLLGEGGRRGCAMSEHRGEEVGQVDHQPDPRELEEAENESQEQGSAPRFRRIVLEALDRRRG